MSASSPLFVWAAFLGDPPGGRLQRHVTPALLELGRVRTVRFSEEPREEHQEEIESLCSRDGNIVKPKL